jgi:lipopolysaccharide heptosyltransferase II
MTTLPARAGSSGAPQSSAPRKILILKPSSLGDVIQALPVLRLLKSQFPTSQIYWWLALDLAPFLKNDRDLAGLIPFDRHGCSYPRGWWQFTASLRQMRREHFDWVIDLQSLLRSGLIAWLAHGRLSIGLDDHREGAGTFYDIAVPRPSFHTHAVDWYLQVLTRLGVPVHGRFEWLPVNSSALARIQDLWQPGDHPWIVLNPGARWPNKRWPAEYYARLVELLATQDNRLRFVVLGAASDRELGQRIGRANHSRCLDLTGQTTLLEMVEWIRLSRLMVTNDTGPMHAAAAMSKPVIALLGPTEPRRTGPYRQIQNVLQSRLPCVPCMKPVCHYEKNMECLKTLDPTLVADAVLRQLRPR